MKRSTLLLLLFIVLKVALQFLLIHPSYELQRDEYLHLDQGHHLAWGYISVPPVTSRISYVIHLLGGSEFWVKFFPLLFGCLTLVVLWKIIAHFNSALFAFLLCGTAFTLSPVLRLNILFQPNSLDVFFGTLVYYTTIKYVATNNSRYLYLTAVAAAFGFLSKYNIVFLLAGLVPGLMLSNARRIFLNRHLYLAAFLALLVVAPNLWWQYTNGFPTAKQLQELQRTQLVNVARADFLKDQLIYFIGSLFIIVSALIGFVVHAPFRKFRYLLLSFIFSFLFFVFFKAKSYYAIGLYPVMMAFGSVYLNEILSVGWKRYLKPVSLAVVIVLAIPFIILAYPVKSPSQLAENVDLHRKLGLLRWEDGKDHTLPQDFADMLGWKELARKVDSAYQMISQKEHVLVLADNYGQAGAINYYSTVKNINAVSYNADYINWIDIRKPIKSVVRVYESGQAEEDIPKLHGIFETVKLIGKIEDENAREFGTTILLLENPKIDVNKVIEADIKDKKW